MGAVQLNVRMDRKLRDAGNAALAQYGLTPSEMVRAVWEVAAQRGEGLRVLVSDALGQSAESTEATMDTEDSNALEQGWTMADAALRGLGIDSSMALDLSDDEEFYAQMMEERAAERGLL